MLSSPPWGGLRLGLRLQRAGLGMEGKKQMRQKDGTGQKTGMARACCMSCPGGVVWKMLVFLFWVARLCDPCRERPKACLHPGILSQDWV